MLGIHWTTKLYPQLQFILQPSAKNSNMIGLTIKFMLQFLGEEKAFFDFWLFRKGEVDTQKYSYIIVD